MRGRQPAKKVTRSATTSSGTSRTAKWPPRSWRVQWTMFVVVALGEDLDASGSRRRRRLTPVRAWLTCGSRLGAARCRSRLRAIPAAGVREPGDAHLGEDRLERHEARSRCRSVSNSSDHASSADGRVGQGRADGLRPRGVHRVVAADRLEPLHVLEPGVVLRLEAARTPRGRPRGRRTAGARAGRGSPRAPGGRARGRRARRCRSRGRRRTRSRGVRIRVS